MDADRKRALVAIKQKEKSEAADRLGGVRDEIDKLRVRRDRSVEKIAELKVKLDSAVNGETTGSVVSAAMATRERIRLEISRAGDDLAKTRRLLEEALVLEEKYRDALGGAIRALQILEE